MEFVVEPTDTVVQNGHTAILDCVAKSSDFAQSTLNIQWLDQDRQILSFIGEPYRSQLTNGSLYIGSVTEEQSLTGTYQCMASLPNNAGSIVSKQAKLSLASKLNILLSSCMEKGLKSLPRNELFKRVGAIGQNQSDISILIGF